MTDSYHFASVPQFRVGGVYRQQVGTMVRLSDDVDSDHRDKWSERLPGRCIAVAEELEGGYCRGYICLDDGRYVAATSPEHPQNLIPGELHQVNGEWVPVEQKLSFPSGSVLTTSGDKIVGREEPAGDDYDEADDWRAFGSGPAKTLGALLQGVLDRGIRKACPEPIRPALTWRTETPFDPFKGFDVEWSVECQAHPAGFASPDLQATSPLCGSAYLLPKTA